MRDSFTVYWVAVLAITSQIPRIYTNHLSRQMPSSPQARVLVIPLSSIVMPNSRSSMRRNQRNSQNVLTQGNVHNSLVALLTRRGRNLQTAPSQISLPRQPSSLPRQSSSLPRLSSSLQGLTQGITASDISRLLLLNQIIEDIRRNRPQPTQPETVSSNNPSVNLEPKTNNKVIQSSEPQAAQKPIIIETGGNTRIKEIRTVNGQTQVIVDSKPKRNKKKPQPFKPIVPTLKPGEDPPETPEMFNLFQTLGKQMGLLP